MKNDRWYRNFKASILELIDEEIARGCRVKGIIITIGLFEKLESYMGYAPDNILGYRLSILDESEIEIQGESKDLIFLESDIIN